jgi:hypothetical protein
MIETIAIQLAVVIAVAVLLYLLVKAYGKLNVRIGGGVERDEQYEANASARQRFDWAARRPISTDAKLLAARMRARADRAGLLKPKRPKP